MRRIQIGGRNVASGNDNIAVQAGRVTGRRGTRSADAAPDTGQAEAEDTARATVRNIRTGDAAVGRQADVVTGGIVIGHE